VTRYEVQSRSQLTVDSAGTPVTETVESAGAVSFTGEREFPEGQSAPGTLRASGRVDGFVMTPTSRLANARASALPGVATLPGSPALPQSVAFDATLDGTITRVAPNPTPANECDHPSLAATALARELLVRLPTTLAVGDAWRETTRVFACRGGVPVTVETTSAFRVLGVETGAEGAVARIERLTTTSASGELASTWRSVSLTGAGQGRYELRVALPTGVVFDVTGQSETRFETRDSARPAGGRAVVVQRVDYRATRRSP
jgi:hypothetical protein